MTMTTMQIIEAIQKQIDAVSPLLERLMYVKAMPQGMKAGGNQAMAKVCYGDAEILEIEEKINRWQYATKTVLATCFGADSEHAHNFGHTIVSHRIYFDAKIDLSNICIIIRFFIKCTFFNYRC